MQSLDSGMRRNDRVGDIYPRISLKNPKKVPDTFSEKCIRPLFGAYASQFCELPWSDPVVVRARFKT
jgi:hypothetical protein